MRLTRGTRKQKSTVYWWSEDIGVLRKANFKSRLVYQRKWKKFGEDLCRETYRKTNVELVQAIERAKDKCWKNLCKAVDDDPWKLRVVIKKLYLCRPIPGINLPGRMGAIVNTLFPTETNTKQELDLRVNEYAVKVITETELKAVARRLPNNKCPGPNGIPNEVVKEAVKHCSVPFLWLFNRCLNDEVNPMNQKLVDIVLLAKIGKYLNDSSDYRPLCILNIIEKLFENCWQQGFVVILKIIRLCQQPVWI